MRQLVVNLASSPTSYFLSIPDIWPHDCPEQRNFPVSLCIWWAHVTKFLPIRYKQNWLDKTARIKDSGACFSPRFSSYINSAPQTSAEMAGAIWTMRRRITTSERWGREVGGTRFPEDHGLTTPALDLPPLDDLTWQGNTLLFCLSHCNTCLFCVTITAHLNLNLYNNQRISGEKILKTSLQQTANKSNRPTLSKNFCRRGYLNGWQTTRRSTHMKTDHLRLTHYSLLISFNGWAINSIRYWYEKTILEMLYEANKTCCNKFVFLRSRTRK